MGHHTYVYEYCFTSHPHVCAVYSLKAIIDRPPIEDREFAPLSELQGFKLLPGAVSWFNFHPMFSISTFAPIKYPLSVEVILYSEMWMPQ